MCFYYYLRISVIDNHYHHLDVSFEVLERLGSILSKRIQVSTFVLFWFCVRQPFHLEFWLSLYILTR